MSFVSIVSPSKTNHASKPSPGERPRQPVAVVGPHFVEGNRVEREPQRRGLDGLDGLAGKIARDEDRANEAVAIGELEVQHAAFFDLQRRDADLFLRLANRRVERSLAGLEFAAGTVDLARAEAAFFADEQHAAVLDDEAEIGVLARASSSTSPSEVRFGKRRMTSGGPNA